MAKKRNQDLQHIVLQTAAVVGGVAVALIAPNALGAMAQMGIIPGKRQKEVINAARLRLAYKGLLVVREGKAFLTPKGKKFLKRWELKNYHIQKPWRWDGKWRILIFDIPERRRRQRALIRQTLTVIGFVRLQDSVWLYPYECEELVTLLKADFNIGKDLLYLTVDQLEQDRPWRRHFDLH